MTDGKRWRERVFLDELPPGAGRYESEPDIECGVLCINEALTALRSLMAPEEKK